MQSASAVHTSQVDFPPLHSAFKSEQGSLQLYQDTNDLLLVDENAEAHFRSLLHMPQAISVEDFSFNPKNGLEGKSSLVRDAHLLEASGQHSQTASTIVSGAQYTSQPPVLVQRGNEQSTNLFAPPVPAAPFTLDEGNCVRCLAPLQSVVDILRSAFKVLGADFVFKSSRCKFRGYTTDKNTGEDSYFCCYLYRSRRGDHDEVIIEFQHRRGDYALSARLFKGAAIRIQNERTWKPIVGTYCLSETQTAPVASPPMQPLKVAHPEQSSNDRCVLPDFNVICSMLNSSNAETIATGSRSLDTYVSNLVAQDQSHESIRAVCSSSVVHALHNALDTQFQCRDHRFIVPVVLACTRIVRSLCGLGHDLNHQSNSCLFTHLTESLQKLLRVFTLHCSRIETSASKPAKCVLRSVGPEVLHATRQTLETFIQFFTFAQSFPCLMKCAPSTHDLLRAVSIAAKVADPNAPALADRLRRSVYASQNITC